MNSSLAFGNACFTPPTADAGTAANTPAVNPEIVPDDGIAAAQRELLALLLDAVAAGAGLARQPLGDRLPRDPRVLRLEAAPHRRRRGARRTAAGSSSSRPGPSAAPAPARRAAAS